MDDLIFCQQAIPKDTLRYGFRSSAATGCGWIAAYNALRLLGYRVDKESLIRWFENQLPLLHGNIGTLCWMPARYFRHYGFPVKLVLDPRQFDQAVKAAPAAILFYHWRQGLKLGAHFVALRYENGRFIGYNTYRNSTGPDDYGPSLHGFMKAKGFFAPVLTVIDTKKSVPLRTE